MKVFFALGALELRQAVAHASAHEPMNAKPSKQSSLGDGCTRCLGMMLSYAAINETRGALLEKPHCAKSRALPAHFWVLRISGYSIPGQLSDARIQLKSGLRPLLASRQTQPQS